MSYKKIVRGFIIIYTFALFLKQNNRKAVKQGIR